VLSGRHVENNTEQLGGVTGKGFAWEVRQPGRPKGSKTFAVRDIVLA
jgi:hypothetical protein